MDDHADLGPQLETYVNELISIGRFNSRDDVLREGVRLVEAREKRAAALEAALARGLADADAGRVRPLADVADERIFKYRAMAEERSL